MTEWLALCATSKLDQLIKWSAEHYSQEVFKFIFSADKIASDDVKDCTESGGYRAVEVAYSSRPDRSRSWRSPTELTLGSI
jgi:hypothetical protein